ncbi:MAG: hypothetical protein H6907_05795 [Hyphomicrobiales bacterium]|nr:hypothetical protein [Hyphomicrobiales bacterium]
MGYRTWVRFASAGLMALFLSGGACEVPQIDPPDLQLTFDPPRYRHVTVVNGAGKVLYDGGLNADGKGKANPELGDLDGTLTVTTVSHNGVTSTYTEHHEPGTPILLKYDGKRDRLVALPTRNGQWRGWDPKGE